MKNLLSHELSIGDTLPLYEVSNKFRGCEICCKKIYMGHQRNSFSFIYNNCHIKFVIFKNTNYKL